MPQLLTSRETAIAYSIFGNHEMQEYCSKIRDLLRDNTHWSHNLELSDLYLAMERSLIICGAYDAIAQKFVGFGRIVGDGIHVAMLTDICIHQDYRGLKIGTTIVRRLIGNEAISDKCRIHAITTQADKFYRLLGFTDFCGSTLFLDRGDL